MADKRKLSTILGICGATVLASGGSVFVTNTALSLVNGEKQVTEAVKPELGNQETEAPISIEQFAKTEDSFTILAKKDKEETEKETASAEDGENNATGSGEGNTDAGTSDGSASSGSSGNSTSDESSGGGSTSGNTGSGNTASGSVNDSTGVRYDEWGGWYNADGDYYDGKGGYYDGNGYHYVGTPDTFTDGSIPNTSVGGSSSGGSSSGSGNSSDDGVDIIDPGTGGGNSGAWDDSYKCYEISSRYLSREELSGWGSEDLAQLRNEIFARHGRIFTTQKWIDYFATKTWYTPTYDAAYFDANMGSFLNDYEWKNLDLILKLEDEIGY